MQEYLIRTQKNQQKLMKYFYFFILLTFISSQAHGQSISSTDLRHIGDKIWENECAKKIEGLTHWNNGENFGSFGIGHFIWYPEGKKERFQESFPDLIKFLQEKGASLPSWLTDAKGCPWRSRTEFYAHIQDPKMIALRQLLFDTRDLQALFITTRLEKSLPEMINKFPDKKRKEVSIVFNKLKETPQGLYALIDYSNFKGMGTSINESYNGQGWGLLQVLERIPPQTKNALADFISTAKELLTQRVQNAPTERHEEKWLKGWLNRIDSYEKFSYTERDSKVGISSEPKSRSRSRVSFHFNPNVAPFA